MHSSNLFKNIRSYSNLRQRRTLSKSAFPLLPLLLISASFLTACGGGGSSDPGATQPGSGSGTPQPGSSTPVNTPLSSTAIIRVNAGGPDYVDSKGQLWAADYGYNVSGESTRTYAINGTVDDALYQTEHWHSGWKDPSTPELEYQFNVPSGDYAIKLHFAEVSQVVDRIFDVEIEGLLIIDDLDIASEVGRNNVLVKNVVTSINDGVLNIRLPRNTQSPKISAIEVLPINSKTSAATTDISPVSVRVPESSGKLSIISQPSNGTAVVNGYNITYNPNTGFGGDDTLIYMLIEPNGSVTISTITVSVDSVSVSAGATPNIVANPDSISTTIDTSVNIPVLVNDSGATSNAVLSIEGTPGNGSASILANNTITYTPNPSYTGPDSFSYRLVDGSVTAIATVTVDVQCTQCAQAKVIVLSWNPSVTGSNAGYRVYFGSDANNVNTLAYDLSSNTGLDPNAPSVQFSPQDDLQLADGDTVCFRISAYLPSIESGLSSPICGVL